VGKNIIILKKLRDITEHISEIILNIVHCMPVISRNLYQIRSKIVNQNIIQSSLEASEIHWLK